jgi:hypothetical protein
MKTKLYFEFPEWIVGDWKGNEERVFREFLNDFVRTSTCLDQYPYPREASPGPEFVFVACNIESFIYCRRTIAESLSKNMKDFIPVDKYPSQLNVLVNEVGVIGHFRVVIRDDLDGLSGELVHNFTRIGNE